MTLDPFRIPDDWVKTDYRTRRPIPGAAASGDVAPTRPPPAGRGNTLHRAVALTALAACIALLWPSIRGGAR